MSKINRSYIHLSIDLADKCHEIPELKFYFPVKPNLHLNVIRKALESLAGRESGESQRAREKAQREMDAVRDAFNKRIADLEQVNQRSCFFGLLELLIMISFVSLFCLPQPVL